jgi:hypothetical protein
VPAVEVEVAPRGAVGLVVRVRVGEEVGQQLAHGGRRGGDAGRPQRRRQVREGVEPRPPAQVPDSLRGGRQLEGRGWRDLVFNVFATFAEALFVGLDERGRGDCAAQPFVSFAHQKLLVRGADVGELGVFDKWALCCVCSSSRVIYADGTRSFA